MRGFLFLLGIAAVVAAVALAVIPVTGEDSIGVGGFRIGTPLDVKIDCGSVVAPIIQTTDPGVVDALIYASTSCAEELEKRQEIVILAGAGGGAMIALALAFTLLLGLWRTVTWVFGLLRR